jgi:hypothetical protein
VAEAAEEGWVRGGAVPVLAGEGGAEEAGEEAEAEEDLAQEVVVAEHRGHSRRRRWWGTARPLDFHSVRRPGTWGAFYYYKTN